MFGYWLVLPGLVFWLLILLLPWRPWNTRESLDGSTAKADLSNVTVLVPARNEAETIQLNLSSIAAQGNINKIVLVDDQSTDLTTQLARQLKLNSLEIIPGKKLPPHWSGKLWALEQGRQQSNTEFILLVDADIELRPGILNALLQKAETERLQLVSLMASLRMQNFWEKLLMPSFIYFFKLLYPFSISNSASKLIAAAAGGCILIRASALQEIGGFHALQNALIDDCALARKIKSNGGRTWIGLTHDVISHRVYPDLKSIWDMVARTAYTQLHYSPILLSICTTLLFMAFIQPFVALFYITDIKIMAVVVTFLVMWGTYLAIIRYYLLNMLWTLSLPIAGILYLLMTWSSAIRHWNGKSAVWKDRLYTR